MSQDAVNALIGKAATDSEFRKLLQTTPEKAFEGFDLTDEEKDALLKMNFESLDTFAGDLDDRISKRRRAVSII